MKKLLPFILATLLVAFTIPAFAGHPGHHGDPAAKILNYIFPDGCDMDMKIRLSKFVLDAEVTATADLYLTYMCTEFSPDSHAAARAFSCQSNDGQEDPHFPPQNNPSMTDLIDNSFKNFTGIIQLNQAAGFINNQGNTAAVAAVDVKNAYTMAEAVAQQANANNEVTISIPKTDKIDDSFASFKGLLQLNQSSGWLNNQQNSAAVAVGSKGLVALADANLVQSNCGNTATLCTPCISNTISNSFNASCTGLVQVNQSAGSLNNQANVLAISAVKQ